MLIIYKLYEPWQRNADIRDRLTLLVLDARTYRLSTNEDVGIHGGNAGGQWQKICG